MKKIIFSILIFQEFFSFPIQEKAKRELEDLRSDDIIILHTNDIHCRVEEFIGYSGLELYKKQLLNKYKNIIIVDAGDHIQGDPFCYLSNGQNVIDIMNKIGYDVATLGDHEFDYGIPQLKEWEKQLNCGYISANFCFRENKTNIFPAYKIIEKGGKKIAFIGVSTPYSLTRTNLNTIVDNKGQSIYYFLTDVNNQELYERIQGYIDKLRNEEKADYVIILSHLGFDMDISEENSSINLLQNLKNVSALIDGHSHLIYSLTTQDVIISQVGKNCLILESLLIMLMDLFLKKILTKSLMTLIFLPKF